MIELWNDVANLLYLSRLAIAEPENRHHVTAATQAWRKIDAGAWKFAIICGSVPAKRALEWKNALAIWDSERNG